MQNEAWTREKITQLKIDPVDARIYDEVKMVWDNLKQLLQRLVQFPEVQRLTYIKRQ